MTHIYKSKRFKKLRKALAIAAACAAALCAVPPSALAWGEDVKVVVNDSPATFCRRRNGVSRQRHNDDSRCAPLPTGDWTRPSIGSKRNSEYRSLNMIRFCR